jgi:hypothetical protein
MSIIEQLQTLALDSSISSNELLLKALLVATKLELPEFKTWIESELHGYQGAVPEYRIVQGQATAKYGDGTIKPIVFGQADVDAQMRCVRIPFPISEVESLARGNDRFIPMSFPSEEVNALIQEIGSNIFPFRNVAQTALDNIVHRVREQILTWTMKLEKDGILGEGVKFSDQEKAIAHSKRDDLKPTFTIINIGTMNNSSIQAASPEGILRHSSGNG